jgi:hypothetical protein
MEGEGGIEWGYAGEGGLVPLEVAGDRLQVAGCRFWVVEERRVQRFCN